MNNNNDVVVDNNIEVVENDDVLNGNNVAINNGDGNVALVPIVNYDDVVNADQKNWLVNDNDDAKWHGSNSAGSWHNVAQNNNNRSGDNSTTECVIPLDDTQVFVEEVAVSNRWDVLETTMNVGFEGEHMPVSLRILTLLSSAILRGSE